MRPDKTEVSWDAAKSSWLIRVEVGEEVVRRHSNLPKTADDQALCSAAQTVITNEGYESAGAKINILR